MVCSITFTGSFIDLPDLSGISDIDTIVIVDQLTPSVLRACSEALVGLDCAGLGLPDCQLHLNTTFGPLKFDEAGRVVVHLMIYSAANHRLHVLKSPFTCLDWERSRVHVGLSLREIYPVLALQPRQFLEARRGLADYLEDLAAGSIQYRRYAVTDDTVQEEIDRQPLDQRHQGEYAYHIVRNLVSNYAKLLRRKNARLATPGLLAFWKHALPASSVFCEWFVGLEARKRARAPDYPADTLTQVRQFLLTFSEELELIWRHRAVRHVFVRHARTACNDGSFLGQRRDPGILETPSLQPGTFVHVFSSPAKRCRETAAALSLISPHRIDRRLSEIDYGAAEGMTFVRLAADHPEIVRAWSRGEDPCFPGGENTAAVAARLEAFIRDLPAEPCLIVTHNVVLRCLLGSGLGLPRSQWHRIHVEHLESIPILQFEGRCYFDLASDHLARITDAVTAPLP
jgi:broad specificity phosphatase PhoE